VQLFNKLPSVSEEDKSSAILTGQPCHNIPVTGGSAKATMTSLPAVVPAVTASSTVAVSSDRLFQSLTTAVVPKDETFFHQRSNSVPEDDDGSLVKSKPMPKSTYML